MQAVRLDVANGVARLQFNRPQSLNAIDVEMAECFLALCRELSSREDVRVIVLSGAGRAFMAGGDLAAFRASEAPAGLASAIIRPLHQALALLAQLPQPVIGSVQGAVAGAGMSLALGCDLTIAARDARFCLAYAGIATSLDGGGSWHLVRQVGLQRALQLALLNDTLSAEQALAWGLIAQVVDTDRLERDTQALAHRLATGPTFAYGHIKRLLRSAAHHPLEEHLEMEHQAFRACAGSADFREGIEAFFARRKASFVGH